MQYQVKKTRSKGKGEKTQIEEEEEEDVEGFVTLVRFTEDNPNGKATALLNWRLLVVELLPEEDAALALLICISILKSVSEMKKEDVGALLMRRRIREQKLGTRDWGSVMLHPSSWSSTTDSAYLQPWYWNADTVMASNVADRLTRQLPLNQSPVEGSRITNKFILKNSDTQIPTIYRPLAVLVFRLHHLVRRARPLLSSSPPPCSSFSIIVRPLCRAHPPPSLVCDLTAQICSKKF